MEHDIFVAPKIEHLPTIWATHKVLLVRGRKFFVFLRRHCLSLIRTRKRNRLTKNADNLHKAGFSLGWVSALDRGGRTIWIADAHRGDGKRFIVRAGEKLTAFVEPEAAIAPSSCEACADYPGVGVSVTKDSMKLSTSSIARASSLTPRWSSSIISTHRGERDSSSSRTSSPNNSGPNGSRNR